MIGLRRGIVKIVPYHKGWKRLYEKEEKRLTKALGDSVVDIQHIGSTSVPGLAAKPLIDIEIGVKSMGGSKKFIKPLAKLGYHFRPRVSNVRYHVFFAKGDQKKRTHYLHLVKYKGKVWTRDITFRDYLRTHKEAAKAYEALKRKLGHTFSKDRAAYTARKTAFRRAIIKKAQKLHGAPTLGNDTKRL